MWLFEIVQHAVIALLTGYLAVSQSLATYTERFIDSFIDTPLAEIEHIEMPSFMDGARKVTTVLSEHSSYKNAALVALREKEKLLTTTNESAPITERINAALVNIFCQYETDSYSRTTTGTGVLIHEKGVVLTNAHVAQFLLLDPRKSVIKKSSCVLRMGDPAVPRYNAELLYLSPTWISENVHVITDASPRGTGAYDYALLYITGSIDGTPLPARFPSISTYTDLMSKDILNTSVLTAGYPGRILSTEGSNAKITPVIATTTIRAMYTFGSQYADIFAVSDSPVGVEGSSGGPIVDIKNDHVIGLIVTKGDPQTEGENSLRAITLSYIDRTITEETGFSLADNMKGDIAQRGTIFKNIMIPFLRNLLEESLTAQSSTR